MIKFWAKKTCFQCLLWLGRIKQTTIILLTRVLLIDFWLKFPCICNVFMIHFYCSPRVEKSLVYCVLSFPQLTNIFKQEILFIKQHRGSVLLTSGFVLSSRPASVPFILPPSSTFILPSSTHLPHVSLLSVQLRSSEPLSVWDKDFSTQNPSESEGPKERGETGSRDLMCCFETRLWFWNFCYRVSAFHEKQVCTTRKDTFIFKVPYYIHFQIRHFLFHSGLQWSILALH